MNGESSNTDIPKTPRVVVAPTVEEAIVEADGRTRVSRADEFAAHLAGAAVTKAITGEEPWRDTPEATADLFHVVDTNEGVPS